MSKEATVKRKPGRPPIAFDQKLADTFCEQIIDGKSMRRICKAKGMPSKKVVLKWLDEHETFRAQYARAREEQAEGYADELMDLQRQANATNAHAIRVKADIIKWVCSKLKPRRFGDRLALEADVSVGPKLPVDRDTLILETARKMAYFIGRASDIVREQRLLPAPIASQSAELNGASAEVPAPTHTPTAMTAEDETRTARVFENEVDRDIRQKEAARPIAAARYRPRWQR